MNITRPQRRELWLRTCEGTFVVPVLHWLTGLILFGVIGCGPKIHSFSVEPRRACPDDTVRISFSVTGTPHLEVTTTSGEGPETVTYTLIAERQGKSRFARQDVVRLSAQQERPLSFPTIPLGTDSLSASDTLPADNWNSSARLAGLSTLSHRDVWVTHLGRVALLRGDGTPSNEFVGLPLAGLWELAAPLKAGEILGDPAHAPPVRLKLLTTIRCSRP
jgi:hypothetical protein